MNDKLAGQLAWWLGAFVGLAALAFVSLVPISSRTHSHAGAIRNACIANLKQIGRAKAVWAMENRVTDLVRVPAMSQLCGPTNYLRDVPTCPGRGNYAVSRLMDKPTCSVPGHAL